MAKTKILGSDEVTEETWFRIKVTKWNVYQKHLKGEDEDFSGRRYIIVKIFGPTDTLLEEPLQVRGLFWELLRLSGAGRRPGFVVAGSDEPLNVARLAKFLWLDVKDILEPLKRLADTRRIQIWAAQSPTEQADLSETNENNGDSQTRRSEIGTRFSVSKTKRNKVPKEREEKRREEKSLEENTSTSTASSGAAFTTGGADSQLPRACKDKKGLKEQRQRRESALFGERDSTPREVVDSVLRLDEQVLQAVAQVKSKPLREMIARKVQAHWDYQVMPEAKRVRFLNAWREESERFTEYCGRLCEETLRIIEEYQQKYGREANQ